MKEAHRVFLRLLHTIEMKRVVQKRSNNSLKKANSKTNELCFQGVGMSLVVLRLSRGD